MAARSEIGAAGEGELFPDPASDAGRVLRYLVAAQIPGTPIPLQRRTLAQQAALSPAAAARALDALVTAGLVMEEASPGGATTITVLVAPPPESYGIVPRWSEAPDAGGAGRATDAGAPQPEADVAEAHRTTPAPVARKVERSGSAESRKRSGRPGAGARRGDARTGDGASAGLESELPPERLQVERADETSLVRGFVERFERLLDQCAGLRRQAQEAEERARDAEKRLAAAERRATTAEARLAAAETRLKAWSDVARRMQQLSRLADGPRGAGRSSLPHPPASSTARRWSNPKRAPAPSESAGETLHGETPQGEPQQRA